MANAKIDAVFTNNPDKYHTLPYISEIYFSYNGMDFRLFDMRNRDRVCIGLAENSDKNRDIIDFAEGNVQDFCKHFMNVPTSVDDHEYMHTCDIDKFIETLNEYNFMFNRSMWICTSAYISATSVFDVNGSLVEEIRLAANELKFYIGYSIKFSRVLATMPDTNPNRHLLATKLTQVSNNIMQLNSTLEKIIDISEKALRDKFEVMDTLTTFRVAYMKEQMTK